MNKSIIVSSAVRLEKKKESLIPRTPKSLANPFDMKENFTNTKDKTSYQVIGEKCATSEGIGGAWKVVEVTLEAYLMEIFCNGTF